MLERHENSEILELTNAIHDKNIPAIDAILKEKTDQLILFLMHHNPQKVGDIRFLLNRFKACYGNDIRSLTFNFESRGEDCLVDILLTQSILLSHHIAITKQLLEAPFSANPLTRSHYLTHSALEQAINTPDLDRTMEYLRLFHQQGCNLITNSADKPNVFTRLLSSQHQCPASHIDDIIKVFIDLGYADSKTIIDEKNNLDFIAALFACNKTASLKYCQEKGIDITPLLKSNLDKINLTNMPTEHLLLIHSLFAETKHDDPKPVTTKPAPVKTIPKVSEQILLTPVERQSEVIALFNDINKLLDVLNKYSSTIRDTINAPKKYEKLNNRQLSFEASLANLEATSAQKLNKNCSSLKNLKQEIQKCIDTAKQLIDDHEKRQQEKNVSHETEDRKEQPEKTSTPEIKKEEPVKPSAVILPQPKIQLPTEKYNIAQPKKSQSNHKSYAKIVTLFKEPKKIESASQANPIPPTAPRVELAKNPAEPQALPLSSASPSSVDYQNPPNRVIYVPQQSMLSPSATEFNPIYTTQENPTPISPFHNQQNWQPMTNNMEAYPYPQAMEYPLPCMSPTYVIPTCTTYNVITGEIQTWIPLPPPQQPYIPQGYANASPLLFNQQPPLQDNVVLQPDFQRLYR